MRPLRRPPGAPIARRSLTTRLVAGALLSSLALGTTGCTETDSSPRLLLEGITVIDGTGAPPRSDLTIVVAERRISRIVPTAEVEARPGDRRIDASGRYAIPGLWDMHVHLSKVKEEALPIFVALGVTGVRDMGSDLPEVRRMENAVEEGRLTGPRIVTPGPMLEAPATIERLRALDTQEPHWRTRVPVPDVGSATRIVDSLLVRGVDFIKIREAGSTEVYREIVSAARARDVMVVGHPPYQMDPVEAASLGVSSFEHASYPYPLDTVPARRESILTAWRAAAIHLVPTLVAWQTHLMVPDSVAVLIRDDHGLRDPRRRLLSEYLVDEWAVDLRELQPRAPGYYRGFGGFLDRSYRDLAAMHEAGIPLMPGTDLAAFGLFPGYSLHAELQNFVHRVGLSEMEALVSATRIPAAFFGGADSLGTLEPGKLADLVILDADPLADIRNTRRIHAVVVRGRYLGPDDLERMLEGLSPTTEGDLRLAPALDADPPE